MSPGQIRFLSLVRREVTRFFKIRRQTVGAPLLETFLYISVFGAALGSRIDKLHGVDYVVFIIPGLIMMAWAMNAYTNNSSSLLQQKFQRSIEDEFTIYKSAGWDGKGGGVLFTAYCTPILRGSLEPDGVYRHPLYALPSDLVKGRDGSVLGWETRFGRRPDYPSRAAIEASGMLAGQELVWLADPIDAYLAHVNGSAFIQLPDGTMHRLGYAGKNGRMYTSLGRELEDDGKIPKGQASLRSIRAWAAESSPEEVRDYLNRNQSFVFFTPIDGNPHGSLDVEVTGGRSLATDKTLFPRGAITFVDTKLGPSGSADVHQFLFDQDTGGAIRTAGRADMYLGQGPEAERSAGATRAEGQLYYLFVKE